MARRSRTTTVTERTEARDEIETEETANSRPLQRDGTERQRHLVVTKKGKHTRFDEAPAPAGQQASRNASVSAAPTTSAWEKQTRQQQQQRREGGDRQQGSAPAGAATGRGGATAPATPAAATRPPRRSERWRIS